MLLPPNLAVAKFQIFPTLFNNGTIKLYNIYKLFSSQYIKNKNLNKKDLQNIGKSL